MGMVTAKTNKSTKSLKQDISYLQWALPKSNKLSSQNWLKLYKNQNWTLIQKSKEKKWKTDVFVVTLMEIED